MERGVFMFVQTFGRLFGIIAIIAVIALILAGSAMAQGEKGGSKSQWIDTANGKPITDVPNLPGLERSGLNTWGEPGTNQYETQPTSYHDPKTG